VRVIVLRGAGGRAFASGADISQFGDQRASREQADAYAKIAGAGRERIGRVGKPVIAAIEGFCVGGGVTVATMADLRIAADSAVFGIPAAKLGLAYGFDSLSQLVGLVGPSCAKELLFTGRRIKADEALRIGLVNRVVPMGELEGAVRELAREIAGNAPLTIRAAKIGIDQLMRDPAVRDMALVEASARACFESGDYAVGREAFLAKRTPEFTGS
jgi:enoyl-CoA hydratase/carnithine racemase